MSKNKVSWALQKVVEVTKRDGVLVMSNKVLARLRYTVQGPFRVLKRSIPPQVKERLRQSREPALPVVDQIILPEGVPLAAVIIPCYNYGKYLPAAVESVLRQTLGNIEVIVVDDGSDDPHTISVLGEIGEGGRVRVIRQPNKGLPAARNTGIRATAARYITCLDADDLIDPTYLEKAVMLLETRPDIGLAYPLAQLFGDVEETWYTEPLDPVKLLQYNHIPVVAVFRREAWEKVGGYDESMRIGYEDWEFWLRLAGEGYGGYLIPERLFKHRRHGKTMTHRAKEKHRQLSEEIRRKHARVARAKRFRASEVKPERAFVNMLGAPRLPGRKRLLVLVPWLTVGGAETVLLQVLKAFAGSGGWQVYLATTLDSPNEWAGRFAEVTPLLFFLPHLLPRRYFTDCIISLISRHEIDGVLISHSELAYLSLAQLRKVAPGLLVLDLLHNDSPEGYARLSARVDHFLNGHIVVHEGIKNTLVERFGLPEGKIFVIPNGVDEEHFKPWNEDRAGLKKKLGLDPAKRQIAFVGRLSIEKNPLLFVKAAARLKHLPGVEWLCYGDGVMEDETRAAAMNLDAPVRFMGACTDTAAILNAVDLLALTSNSEGLPMVVLEALLCGVPVVATDVGCLAGVVRDGVNGYLVEKGDL
ncbi:MAG: glycosyltransferase, partial [Peptococcaceae bacterium]|nr:glycosyltransferase [Peptococcaceae bacterium]